MPDERGESTAVICLTPTKNEAWVINHFLEANSTWADRLVIADQGSTDGTLERLRTAPNVTLVVNDSAVFDERHRQTLLIHQARTFPGRRILIALDADEALSANALQSPEWQKILSAPPGTVLRFKWVNVLPGFETAWVPGHTVFGFVDDGSEHTPQRIHSRRVPCPDGAPTMDLDDIVVLHFQYTAWDRMASKHRWYQVWELLEQPWRGPLDIFRHYHHMHGSWQPDEIQRVDPRWLEGYHRIGIDYRRLQGEALTWWDRELVHLLITHGPERFRQLAIWDKDWRAAATLLGLDATNLSDPRSVTDKVIHRLLMLTQKHRGSIPVRLFERLLRVSGW